MSRLRQQLYQGGANPNSSYFGSEYIQKCALGVLNVLHLLRPTYVPLITGRNRLSDFISFIIDNNILMCHSVVCGTDFFRAIGLMFKHGSHCV
eukprot:1577036-Prymnesium_polylepis.2